MPERPDLEYQVPILSRELVGRQITGVRVDKPVVLRVTVPGDIATLLTGQTIASIVRKGPFVCFDLDRNDVAIHPMLAGRFTITDPAARKPADRAVTFDLSDGRELRYRDDKQMGKVYVLAKGAWDAVPGLGKIGVDVLGPEFTFEVFQKLAKKRRDQVKPFLLDHAALDSMGNAYGDEVMWAAGIHPKARVSELDVDQLRRLHGAIVDVLSRARDEIASRKPALDEKLRDFLAVRNRKGEACPKCGDTIRACGIHGHDAFFCPTCQPDGKGRTFVDWRKLR